MDELSFYSFKKNISHYKSNTKNNIKLFFYPQKKRPQLSLRPFNNTIG